MKLTSKEIEHVAQLARLHLTLEEKKKFAKQLSAILDYVSELGRVAVDGVSPAYQVTGQHDIIRDDRVEESDSETKTLIMSNVPKIEGSHVKVKGVFEKNDEL